MVGLIKDLRSFKLNIHMKNSMILFGLMCCLACSFPEVPIEDALDSIEEPPVAEPWLKLERPSFQAILDSTQVKGIIAVFDQQKNTYYSNDFEELHQGHLPASTFKITNSIIALETGVVDSDSTLFRWDGEPRRLPIWEQDLVLRDAFHYSCVPCYQEVARAIGPERMNPYLAYLDYGKMVVDSSSIDTFWLVGESKITPAEQIDFLKRFYYSELPISARTETIMKRMMVIEDHPSYTISGKTGWSIRNDNNNGWFVGYVEVADNVFFFAINISPDAEFNMDMFSTIRKEIGYRALNDLGVIP